MDLFKIARECRENAHAPYSKVKVGAALLTSNQKVFKGVNIENVRFGNLICAERNAIYNAILNGEKEFKELVVVANYKGELKPCRLCRSAISEFCPSINIKTLNLSTNQELTLSLKDLYNNTLSFELRSRLRMLIRKILQ